MAGQSLKHHWKLDAFMSNTTAFIPRVGTGSVFGVSNLISLMSPRPSRKVPRRGSARRVLRPPSRRVRWGDDVRMRVMEIIRENPDITLAEVSKKLGIPYKSLYSIVRSLERRGLIERPKVKRRHGKELEEVLKKAVDEYFSNPRANVKDIARKYKLSLETLYKALYQEARAGRKLRWDIYREERERKLREYRLRPVKELIRSVFSDNEYADVRSFINNNPVLKDIVKGGNLADIARKHGMSLLETVKYYIIAKAMTIPRKFKDLAGYTPTEIEGYYRHPVKTTITKKFNEAIMKHGLKDEYDEYVISFPMELHRMDVNLGLLPKFGTSMSVLATRRGRIDITSVVNVAEAYVLKKGTRAIPKEVRAKLPIDSVPSSASVNLGLPKGLLKEEDTLVFAYMRGRRVIVEVYRYGNRSALAIIRASGNGIDLSSGGQPAVAVLWPPAAGESLVMKAMHSGPIGVVDVEGVPVIVDSKGRIVGIADIEPVDRSSLVGAMLTSNGWPIRQPTNVPKAVLPSKALARRIGNADDTYRPSFLRVVPEGDRVLIKAGSKIVAELRGGNPPSRAFTVYADTLKWFLKACGGNVRVYALDDSLMFSGKLGDLVLFSQWKQRLQ